MNHICTWLCVDRKGEESHFPQTGRLSSGAAHQQIYWRCILLFFITSKRFHPYYRHLLFTNTTDLPFIDGVSVAAVLQHLGVTVIHTPFGYKTPKGYYGLFQNQFYEFSILEDIATHQEDPNDLYLVLDSDCVFLRPTDSLFAAAAPTGFLSFEDEVSPEYVINGLSRNDMRAIYTTLLGHDPGEPPAYHLGEFLLCSAATIQRLHADFSALWPRLLERHKAGLPKFNEEAHTLSYLYYRNGLRPSPRGQFMKRIWTNPVFYRNVEPADARLAIWHLPAEKTYGIPRLYHRFIHEKNYGLGIPASEYHSLLAETMGIPHLSTAKRIEYYTKSVGRAIVRRMRRLLPKHL